MCSSKAHAGDPHPEAKRAREVLVPFARDLDVRDLLEVQDVLVERQRALEVTDRDRDRIHRLDQCARPGQRT
jgi:hypothetical protein